jgi:hypothetical protein
VNEMCDIWQIRFAEATDFRGSLRCRYHPPTVSITSPASDLSVWAGDTVEFIGESTDADGDAVEMRWRFPGVTDDTTGEGPHPVTFTSTGVYEATVVGVDDTGMFAEGDDSVRVTVACPTTPPAETVEDLRLDLQGEQIHHTWQDLIPPPTDYVVLSSGTPSGVFLPVDAAPSGTPGLLIPILDGIVFYKVAAREDPGCLGPY